MTKKVVKLEKEEKCEHRYIRTAWKEFGNIYVVYELMCSKCLHKQYLEANPKNRSPQLVSQ